MTNYYVDNYRLKPTDEIIVPKSAFNIIQHHALYLGYDEHGTHWIIHNAIGVGVTLITVDDFFRLCPVVTKIVRFLKDNLQRKEAVQRALQNIGRSYDLINYNCEHFTSDAKNEKAQSPQLDRAVLGLGILFIAAILWD